MNNRKKVESAIALVEKKLWHEQASVNKHHYFLWLYKQRRQILLASLVLAPALFFGIRAFGGAKFLLRLTRQFSNVLLAIAISRVKSSVWQNVTHQVSKKLH